MMVELREVLGKPGDNPGMDGVVLYTTMADTPHGRAMVLFGVATDAAVVARLSIMCNGELPSPVLIPVADLTWMIKVLDKAAAVDVDGLVSLHIDPDDSYAKMVVEAHGGKAHPLPLGEVDQFPLEWALKVLNSPAAEQVSDRDGREVPAGNLLVVPGPYMALMAKMSKRFGGQVRLYVTGHPAGRLLASIGPWRGSFPGTGYAHDAEVTFPEDQIPVDMPVESDSAGQ